MEQSVRKFRQREHLSVLGMILSIVARKQNKLTGRLR
jgi:hypothetical protein